jgi:hypothetical protein
MHGYSRDFARILTTRGIDAEPLSSARDRLSEDASGAQEESET